jgi:hypothetical protein
MDISGRRGVTEGRAEATPEAARRSGERRPQRAREARREGEGEAVGRSKVAVDRHQYRAAATNLATDAIAATAATTIAIAFAASLAEVVSKPDYVPCAPLDSEGLRAAV